MGHSHGHGGGGLSHEEQHRINELMYEDERAMLARAEVAVAKLASPMWSILAVFGIYRR